MRIGVHSFIVLLFLVTVGVQGFRTVRLGSGSMTSFSINEQAQAQAQATGESFSIPGIPAPFQSISEEIVFKHVTTDKARVEAYCLSDLHADSIRNQEWVRDHCVRPGWKDDDVYTVMIVPGDIGTEIESLGMVFSVLAANYDAVVYCVGNHECWRRGTKAGGKATEPEKRTATTNRMARNSVDKVLEVLQCARDKGVHVGPLRVTQSRSAYKGLTVMPLQSWYHCGWDKEPDMTDPFLLAVEDAVPFSRKWGDFVSCLWTDLVEHREFASTSTDSLKLPLAFASLNTPFLGDAAFMETIADDTVLSFSHFLPRQELCPEKRFLLEPNLAKVIGSDPLEQQVRELKPHLHMFGHTHIPIDLTLDGVRYLQWPLGYQRESDKQCGPVFAGGPLRVYDSDLRVDSEGGLPAESGVPTGMESETVTWTKYYRENARDPTNMTLAPWVQKRLQSYEGFVNSKKKDVAAKNKLSVDPLT